MSVDVRPGSVPMQACDPTRGAPGAVARFAPEERRLLLSTPGIGLGVVDRLESSGIHSLAQIRALGVQGTVLHVCQQLGSMAWANRRNALGKALAQVSLTGA